MINTPMHALARTLRRPALEPRPPFKTTKLPALSPYAKALEGVITNKFASLRTPKRRVIKSPDRHEFPLNVRSEADRQTAFRLAGYAATLLPENTDVRIHPNGLPKTLAPGIHVALTPTKDRLILARVA